MKLIEALKEKKISKKKIEGIIRDITKYASITSVEKPSFDSEKTQKEHVMSLVQSAIDLLKRRALLKILIDKTNLTNKIRIPKGVVTSEHEITIAEALMFKLNYSEYLEIYKALSKTNADLKLRSMSIGSDGSKVHSIQLYDEEFKNSSLKDLQMKFDYIDSHLEIINATTEIVE